MNKNPYGQVIGDVAAETKSDFRPDTGPPVDIFNFHEKFLKRTLSEKQKEMYRAVWGEKGNEWSTEHSEVVMLIGMKGGKNFWSEGDVAYVCYFITCLRDPHEFFSKLTGRPIPYTKEKTFDIVNVSSVDENQARRSFFESVKRVLSLTTDPKSGKNFFEKYAGLDLREGFGDFKRKEVVFPTGQLGVGGIRLLSFNSTSTAPEGIHILRFYADELSRADTKAKHRNAMALLELGLNNTSASFPNRVGKVIAWSYPNDTDFDLTSERYALSHTNENIFAKKYATWEFNPSQTKDMLSDRYNADPVKAKRVYECEKPISKDNFFAPYAAKLDEIVNSKIKSKVTYNQQIINRQTNDRNLTFTSVQLTDITGDYRQRAFAIDAAQNKDAFVILGGYVETRDPLNLNIFTEDTPQIVTTNVKPVIDIAIVINPSKEAPVDYIGVGNIIALLLKAFPNTQSINSDHFQNEKLSQEIIAKGVSSKTYFFSNQKQIQLYTLLRRNVWNNNIEIFQDVHQLPYANKVMNATDALLWEAKNVLLDNGKIDHPSWGSKDILDALAILNSDLMGLEAKGLLASDIEPWTDEKFNKLRDIYFAERMKLVNRLNSEGVRIREDEMNRMIREKMGFSESNMKKLLDALRKPGF